MRYIDIARPTLICVLILLFAPTFARSQSPTDGSKSGRVEIVKNDAGWKIPKHRPDQLASRSRISIGGDIVDQRIFRLGRTPAYVIIDVFQSDAAVIVNIHDVSVNTVIEYSNERRVFAYEIHYSPILVSKSGVETIAGASITKYYSDEDGDGKFETAYDVKQLPDHVPKWALGK